MEIPIIIIPKGIAKKIGRKFLGIGEVIAKPMAVGPHLKKIKSEYRSGEYAVISVVSSLMYTIMIYFLMLALLQYRGMTLEESRLLAIWPSFAGFLLFMLLHSLYPKTLSRKVGELIDKDLVFALKDMVLHVTSGVTLFEAIVEVSNADYGLVSEEYAKMIREVEKGMAFDEALEEMAIETDSNFLKRISWQLVNAIRAGASLEGALRSFVDSLVEYQERQIKNYTQDLNMYSLMYLLFAVAIPTMGLTVLVIMSSFAGLGLNQWTFAIVVFVCTIIQILLISLVEGRRPSID